MYSILISKYFFYTQSSRAAVRSPLDRRRANLDPNLAGA